jgi:segregation and condensation protein A
MTSTEFKVKTDEFEGPLELLLGLIEKRKLFINDISLSQIANDYVEYIKQFENFPVGEAANFIVIATTLVLAKSKSLLPNLELTVEEEASIEDLEERLRQYKEIKELSGNIRKRFGMNIIFLPQTRMKNPIFSPHEDISNESLLKAISNVVAGLPIKQKKENPKAVVKKILSLEEVINNLTLRIKKNLKMSFKDFTNEADQKDRKITTIVGFLAMLELVKNGLIFVSQEYNFDDINMESQEVAIPKYS